MTKTAAQLESQKRWLSQPEVAEDQREKSRLRAARNRARLKAKQDAASPPEPEATTCNNTTKRRRRKRKRGSSSLPPSILCDPPTRESSADPASHQSISHKIRTLRLQYTNWTYNLGPENLWETRFNEMLDNATGESQVAVDELFIELAEHARQGRDILTGVKYAGSGHCDEQYGVLMDLFVQGFELAVGLTSEVKFFEVKLDEFAPATPLNILSDVRKYPG